MDLITEEDYKKYLETLNYMVVYPDKTIKYYKSLRKIRSEIFVDSSTISKKLNENEGSCFVTCRINDYIYFIKKLDFR
tara:strand:+ start:1753 stop:1986 length:234 start_codon:yes stop_codon:yes gene_type:complete